MKNGNKLWALVFLLTLMLSGCRLQRILQKGDPVLYPDMPRNTTRAEEFVTLEDGTVTYPGAIQGIDVSAHQQEIDWERVRAAGISFAILQIGFRGYGNDGTLNLDSSFVRNYEGARAAGISVGVYFYSQATSVEEAQEEADFVLGLLEDRELDLPVFFDWEEVREGRTRSLADRRVTDFARTFCTAITDGGYAAGVYFNQEYGLTCIRLDQLRDLTFWLAEYRGWQSFDYRVHFWQYTGQGQVDGIDTPVDRVLMYTDNGEE